MMAEKIERDLRRFIDTVKGRIKKNLKEYFKPGRIKLPDKKGGTVAVPIPRIDIPTFRYGRNHGGVGRGSAQPGDDLGPVSEEPQEGEGEEKKAGEGHGEEVYIEFTEEEILEILKAELPRIQPKGEKLMPSEEVRYSTIRRTGPPSLLHRKRTFKQALKRGLAEGSYSPDEPKVIPTKEDKRYKSWKPVDKPQSNAVIIFMRDISGSMGDEEIEITRYICFLTELFLRSQYDELQTAYIVHDTEARQVRDQADFLRIHFGGGTLISSAHEELIRLIYDRFPPESWNIYVTYFSDGMNWGEDDEKVMELLKERILPVVNQYAYGEITTPRWWWGERVKKTEKFSEPGNFGFCLAENFPEEKKVVWDELYEPEEALEVFKKFYGKGN